LEVVVNTLSGITESFLFEVTKIEIINQGQILNSFFYLTQGKIGKVSFGVVFKYLFRSLKEKQAAE